MGSAIYRAASLATPHKIAFKTVIQPLLMHLNRSVDGKLPKAPADTTSHLSC